MRAFILLRIFRQSRSGSSGDISRLLLRDHEEDFIRWRFDGTLDRTDYNAVSAMISRIRMGAFAAGDELSYNIRAIDMEQQRRIMKKIFEVMGVGRHYIQTVHLLFQMDQAYDSII